MVISGQERLNLIPNLRLLETMHQILRCLVLSGFAVAVLCTAMPYGMADYNYRCTPLPEPIVVEKGVPLPDQLSPRSREHTGTMLDALSGRIEVIQFATTDVLILRYGPREQPTNRIIVNLDGSEHNFYMKKMNPVAIVGYGVANESRHVDIAFVGEYSPRIIKAYRDEKELGTTIEVTPAYFQNRCGVSKD